MASKRAVGDGRPAAAAAAHRSPSFGARDARDGPSPGLYRSAARRRPRRPRRGMTAIVAIDAGTTGVRAFAVGSEGRPLAWSYREFPQHFPQPGWVEHDADDIWRVTLETVGEVSARLRDAGEHI